VILFLDTSALVKLYLTETGSQALLGRIENTVVAVSHLTYGETYATFARRLREGLVTPDEFRALQDAFENDWASLTKIPFSSEVLQHVPRLCTRYPLRGADAMQLACASMLQEAPVKVLFATSDRQLVAAASSEGIAIFDPERA
jgi:uncharacterized protein